MPEKVNFSGTFKTDLKLFGLENTENQLRSMTELGKMRRENENEWVSETGRELFNAIHSSWRPKFVFKLLKIHKTWNVWEGKQRHGMRVFHMNFDILFRTISVMSCSISSSCFHMLSFVPNKLAPWNYMIDIRKSASLFHFLKIIKLNNLPLSFFFSFNI